MYAQDYARTYRANSILTASPGQLVLLLFDAALNSLAIARKACDEAPNDPRQLQIVHAQLVKAQKIIAELQARSTSRPAENSPARCTGSTTTTTGASWRPT